MTTESPTTCGAAVRSSDLLGARHPAVIGGKRNPEYTRWYRRMKPESVTNYNNSEKGKACRKRHAPKVKAAKHEAGQPAENQTKCVDCGSVYDRIEAHIRGFRILKGNRGYRCICDECA
jgi:hypothetical protein